MKHKIISFLVLTTIGMNTLLLAQNKDLNHICYKEVEMELITVPKDLDLNSLTNLDKLHFKRRSITKQHESYFDDKGQLTLEINFLSHSNFYPPWYQGPSRMKINDEGTETYFESPTTGTARSVNKLLRKQGSETEQRKYDFNADTGEKYLSSPHTPQSKSAYLDQAHLSTSKGLLHQFTFKVPSQSELDQFKAEGLVVEKNAKEVKVIGKDLTTIWDLERLIVLKEQSLDGGTSITTQWLYGKEEGFDDILLKKTITKVPDTFMDGQAFIRLSIRTYGEYSSQCSRKVDQGIEEELGGNQLSVFPNPSSEQVNIVLPKGEGKAKLSILDVTGQLIKSRKIDQDKGQFTLRVKDMPQGIYLIKIEKGETIYTTKFIKQ